jgi:hypothetical protein
MKRARKCAWVRELHYCGVIEHLPEREAAHVLFCCKELPDMAREAVNMANQDPRGESPRKIPACSICEGTMVLAYDRYQQKVCVCIDCHTSITIPGSAWDVARAKREAQHLIERAPGDRRRGTRRAADVRLPI